MGIYPFGFSEKNESQKARELHNAWEENLASLDKLLEEHRKVIRAIICRFPRLIPFAEEIEQEVVLKVKDGLPGFQGRSKLSRWVGTITSNYCISLLEKPQYRNAFGDLDEGVMNLPSPHPTTEQLFIRRDTIDRFVVTLNENERRVFLLRYEQNLLWADVAVSIGASLSYALNIGTKINKKAREFVAEEARQLESV